MGYKIDWRTIREEYRENKNDTVKKFLEAHPIDWALFVPSRDGLIDGITFAQQQGWADDSYERYIDDYFIKHIIAADQSAPEDALMGIIPAERWDYVYSDSPDYPVQVAILTNPNTTEKVLYTMCICFPYWFHGVGDVDVFRYVFENPKITNRILEEIADRAYSFDASEPYKLMSFAPEYLLELMFKKIAAQEDPYIFQLAYLAEASNVSQQLLTRIAEFVLSADEKGIEYYEEEMIAAVDALLDNPNTPKEFVGKLKKQRAALL